MGLIVHIVCAHNNVNIRRHSDLLVLEKVLTLTHGPDRAHSPRTQQCEHQNAL